MPQLVYSRQIQFRRLSLNEGLSQSIVHFIFKDSKGFMWFGTQDGLNRYDGHNFVTYHYSPFDSTSLSDSNVSVMIEDSRGDFWIGTLTGGLNRLNRRTNAFRQFLPEEKNPAALSGPDVIDLLEDGDGHIWVLTQTGNLDRYDSLLNRFFRYRHNSENRYGLHHSTVTALLLDSASRLWAGTPEGLHLYEKKADHFKIVYIDKEFKQIESLFEASLEKNIIWISAVNPDSPLEGILVQMNAESGETRILQPVSVLAGISSAAVKVFHEGHSGCIWLGTSQGLQRYDKNTGGFEHYIPNPENPQSPANQITIVQEDVFGNLWMTTEGEGIWRFNTKEKSFHHFNHDPSDPVSLSHNDVTAIYEDSSGVLWIGTNAGGLNIYDHYTEKFETFSHHPNNPNSLSGNMVRAVMEDEKGNLWIGLAENGLNRFSPDRKSVRHFQHDPENSNSISSNRVWSLHEDRSGAIWAGTFDAGLNRYQPASGKWTRYISSNNPSGLSSNVIRVITQDEKGMLWIGTDGGGLNRFNPQTQRFDFWMSDPDDSTTIANNSVRAIHVDKMNRFWIGTWGGFHRFYPESGVFKRYLYSENNSEGLSSNMIQSIDEDREGRLWLGTFGGGLNVFDPQTEKFEVFTRSNSGISSNVVYGVMEDGQGSLWLSTNNGTCQLFPDDGRFKIYTVDDGLQSLEFNGQAYFQNKKGEMFFGGINGFNAFFPDSIMDNHFVPPVILTDLKVFDQSIRNRSDKTGLKTICEIDSISLSHRENDITVTFALLHYNQPLKNLYSYMLENYDRAWRQPGRERQARYTNLDPGRYVFKVKAANNDGIWTPEPAVLVIYIKHPWYQTNMAYAVYILLLMGIVFAVDRFQRGRLIRREREESLMREAQLRARTAEAQAKAVEAEEARMKYEIEQARQVQLSMLPEKIPQPAGLEIAVYMKTATEVGGDYYDFHISKNGVLTTAVGDATGHGLNAGMMVSVVKSLFVAHAIHEDMRSLFQDMNITLRHINLGRLYMGMMLARIKGHSLIVTSAGMPPLLLYRSAVKQIETIEIKGLPLGAVENLEFKQACVNLQKDDVLLFMTDGYLELFNSNREEFGEKRVQQAFLSTAHKTPEKIIQNLVKAGETWRDGHPLHDDMTFVVIRVKD